MNRFGRFSGGRFGHFGDAGLPGSQGNMPAPGQQSMPGSGSAPLPEDQYGPYHKNVKFWFTYQTPNIASLAPSSTTTNSIVFDNDSAFEWTKTTYSVDKTNAALTDGTIIIPFVTIQIQDTGQGAYYSNAPVPMFNIASMKLGLPYVMPAPQIIAPNATLQFNWASFSTSSGSGGGNETYTNLRIQLHGWKIRR